MMLMTMNMVKSLSDWGFGKTEFLWEFAFNGAHSVYIPLSLSLYLVPEYDNFV